MTTTFAPSTFTLSTNVASDTAQLLGTRRPRGLSLLSTHKRKTSYMTSSPPRVASTTATTASAVPARATASGSNKKKYTRTTVAQTNGGAIPTANVSVVLERPTRDTRTVLASVLIRTPLETVWGLLSDYSELATHIPNLALSDVLRTLPNGTVRVRQCGTQSIMGFTFKAAVTLDMRQVQPTDKDARAIEFRRAPDDDDNNNNNADFKAFHGVWKLARVTATETALYYDVTVSPKGLVPVQAIEWRISEDVPANVEAVKRVCENRYRAKVAQDRRSRRNKNINTDS